MRTFRDVVQENRAWYCLDCGKCSSVCPVTIHLADTYTSPRLLVETAVVSGQDTTQADPLLWTCLTCRRCSEICPSGVDFPALIQQTRQLASAQGLEGACTHSGVIQAWTRLMANPDLAQNRLGWVTDDLRLDQAGDTIYFPGCLPYYDTAFADLGFEGVEIARAAVRILNYLDIHPQVLEDERCCGHDLYWQGDMASFQQLAALNLAAISRSGARRIITTCPECAYTLKHTYRNEVGGPELEVFHLTEFLAGEVGLALAEKPCREGGSQIAAYQDPCRLGRYAGVYQQPRDLLVQRGFELQEMEHSRQTSICCGTSCWTSCGATNKRIQVERLQEARATGAEVLVTACPKCQIHLKCAQRDPLEGEKLRLEIRDITTILAESI